MFIIQKPDNETFFPLKKKNEFPPVKAARTESLRLTSTLPSDSTLVDGNTWGKGGQKSSGDRSCKGSRRGSTYELHTMDKMSSKRWPTADRLA